MFTQGQFFLLKCKIKKLLNASFLWNILVILNKMYQRVLVVIWHFKFNFKFSEKNTK